MAPKDWTFEASNDGISWTILDTVTGETDWGSGETRTYTTINGTEYAHYRLHISDNNGSVALAVGKIEFIEAQTTNELLIDTSVTFSDEDSASLRGVEIKLDGHEGSISEEVLSIVEQGGITQSYSEINGSYVLSLSGDASTATYEAVLETLSYKNDAVPVISGVRTLSITIFDKDGMASDPHSLSINVNGDIAPVLEGYASSVDYYKAGYEADGDDNNSITNAVPAMSSNSSAEGTITVSDIWSSKYPAWYAFNNTTSGKPWAADIATDTWIAFEFTEDKAINKYTVSARSDHRSYASMARKIGHLKPLMMASAGLFLILSQARLTGVLEKRVHTPQL